MTALDRSANPHPLQLRSLLKPDGELEVSLAEVEVPKPGPNEVLVRVDAAPVNPSDLMLLFGPADFETLKVSGTPQRPVVTLKIPDKAMKRLAARVGQALPVGNEGAGVVVEAGSDPKAQALAGKTVALIGGAMYAQYRVAPADQVLPLPDGVTAAEGAAAFVNPLTALGMVETMRMEGHKALVHTAAASALGQMLQRVCNDDGIPLVNIVRKEEQAAILRGIGAKYVLDSTSPTFLADLTEAVAETGATLGFDAIGGGKVASQILSAMETAISRNAKEYSRYGSATHKQVYIYGALDTGPTELVRDYGFAWGVGSWLLTYFLQKAGPEVGARMRKRVASEIKTTFATSYAKEVSLPELLSADAIGVYARRATGGKYLLVPSKGA